MSSTATVNPAPSGTNAATTARAGNSPTASRSHAAREKNRCPRDQSTRPASPAADHIPVTCQHQDATV